MGRSLLPQKLPTRAPSAASPPLPTRARSPSHLTERQSFRVICSPPKSKRVADRLVILMSQLRGGRREGNDDSDSRGKLTDIGAAAATFVCLSQGRLLRRSALALAAH